MQAEMIAPAWSLAVGALAAGLAAAAAVSALMSGAAETRTNGISAFECDRRARMRRQKWVCRNLGGWVEHLSHDFDRRTPQLTAEVESLLRASGDTTGGRPGEWVAAKWVEGAATGLVAAIAALVLAHAPFLASLALAPLIALVQFKMALAHLRRQAGDRRRAIGRRLPFMLDLMALMCRAGALPTEAVKVVAALNHEHPLGQEFSRVVADLEAGLSHRIAFDALAKRTGSTELNDFATAVVQAIDVGTHLAVVFKSQAQESRQRQSTAAKKLAGESGVKMVGPTMLVMLACLIVVVAPFLMMILNQTGAAQ